MHLASQHHSFDIKLAALYGVDEAILIHHFMHWIRLNYNTGKKRNIRDGRCWTYQTRKEIQAHFPYWTLDHVKYLCEKLVKMGVIVTANYNKSKIDKTLWYAFVDEKSFGVDEENSKSFYERQKCPSRGKSALREGKSAPPIPDTKTDTKAEDREISPIVPGGDLPSSKRKRKAETKTEVAPEVSVTPTQKEDLVKRLGEQKAQACFQKLSIWKIGKGITGGNDYKSIHNWVIKAVNEDENKPKPEDKEKSNKRLAENIAENATQLPADCRIDALHKGIEINRGVRNCEVINYNDPYFKDKLTHVLRKLNLDIKSFEKK